MFIAITAGEDQQWCKELEVRGWGGGGEKVVGVSREKK